MEPQDSTTPPPEPKANLQDIMADMREQAQRYAAHRKREAGARYDNPTRSTTGSMRPLLSAEEKSDLLAVIARSRANAKKRQAAEQARQEQERQAFLASGGTCWTCRDSGYVIEYRMEDRHGVIEPRATKTEKPCPECPRGQSVLVAHEQQQAREMLDRSGLSERVRDFTLASYPAQDNPAFADVVDFLAQWDEHEGLILKGPYGSGKTGLLAGLVREIAALYVAGGRPERRIMWTTGVALMDALRPGSDDDARAVRLDTAKKCSLLVIDDIGAEKPSEWVLERLFAIINERYEGLRPTFVSTNYGLAELAERIGPRVLERLTETGCVIEVTGPNLRRRGGAS